VAFFPTTAKMPTPRLRDRCGLCNFELYREDIIIVGKHRISLLIFRDTKIGLAVKEDDEKPGPLPFHPWTRIANDDEAAQLGNAHPACPKLDQCAHPFEEGVGCHPSCLRIVDGAPLGRVFQPSPRLERARRRWLQDELASTIETYLPLPVELRRAVAGHPVQEFAGAKNASLSLSDRVAISNVSVASAITETYTTFKGQRYLKCIRNAPVSDDSWVPPEVIYVAEDHASIRQVILANDFITVSDVSGVWRKSFSVYGSDNPVCFHIDVTCSSLGLMAMWLTEFKG
jgi:hypothetical protein